jgi:hypothetical protein
VVRLNQSDLERLLDLDRLLEADRSPVEMRDAWSGTQGALSIGRQLNERTDAAKAPDLPTIQIADMGVLCAGLQPGGREHAACREITGMSEAKRTKLEQQIVEALIESNAINFEALGSVLSRYGAEAARAGTNIGVIINRHVIWGCIPPEPFAIAAGVRQIAGEAEE